MPSLEKFHESIDLLHKKDSLPNENSRLLEGFSHLKYATNETSSKFVAGKWFTSKSISHDLALKYYFEYLSRDEQEVQKSCPTILAANIS